MKLDAQQCGFNRKSSLGRLKGWGNDDVNTLTLCDRLQQSVLRTWIDGAVLCRRMRDAFHRGALQSKWDPQLGWGCGLGFRS